MGKQPMPGCTWRAVSNNWPRTRRTVLRELINPLRRHIGDYQGCDRSLAVDPAPGPVGGYRQGQVAARQRMERGQRSPLTCTGKGSERPGNGKEGPVNGYSGAAVSNIMLNVPA